MNSLDKMEDYDRLKGENAKLREQLAAASKRLESALLVGAENRQRAESAEAKLKVLSAQEPVAWLGAAGKTYDCKATMTRYSVGGYYAENAQSVEQRRMRGYKLEPFGYYPDLPKYYAAPVQPASVPEPCICLTNIFDNDQETGEKKHCHDCGGTGTVQPALDCKNPIEMRDKHIGELEQQIAELKRKLAEQQVATTSAVYGAAKLSACLFDYHDTCPECGNVKGHMPNYRKVYAKNFNGPQDTFTAYAAAFQMEAGVEELNTLLAQAREEGRKEAVPEGVVSIDAGFDYQGGGVTTPTLKLYFASGIDSNELWLSRDKAKKILSSYQNGSIQHAGEIDRLKQERDELAAQVEVMLEVVEDASEIDEYFNDPPRCVLRLTIK